MFIKLYFIALPILFIMDMLWLVLIARSFYVSQIGSLMKPDINWAAAIIFYLLFIIGLVVFAIMPGIAAGSWTKALMLGAFFGFISYATYDLTNLATLKDWPFLVSIVDLVWGAVLAGVVSTSTFFIAAAIGLS